MRLALVLVCALAGCESSDTTPPAGGGSGGEGGRGGAEGGGGSSAGGGGRWDCLGEVVAPSPTAPAFDLSITLRDYTSGDDIVGAILEACARDDEPCASPITQG